LFNINPIKGEETRQRVNLCTEVSDLITTLAKYQERFFKENSTRMKVPLFELYAQHVRYNLALALTGNKEG